MRARRGVGEAQQRQAVATRTAGDQDAYREERQAAVDAANAAALEAVGGEEPVDEESGVATVSEPTAEMGTVVQATPEKFCVEVAREPRRVGRRPLRAAAVKAVTG